MRIDVLTLFPAMFEGPLTESIVGRARKVGLVEVRVHDIRDFSTDKHRTVDDYPFGGGAGMVMRPEPLFACIEAYALEEEIAQASGSPSEPGVSASTACCRMSPPDVLGGVEGTDVGETDVEETRTAERRTGAESRFYYTATGRRFACPIIFMTPQGKTLNQEMVKMFGSCQRLIILCGHYEGIDERVRQDLITHEVSIGDYVLTGGELPAMVLIDSVCRMIPGVLKEQESYENDSFYSGLLEHPHYSRPREFRGMTVPDVLISGHHERIRRWRRKESLRRTFLRRPELLEKVQLSREDLQMLDEIKTEEHAERELRGLRGERLSRTMPG